MTERTLKLSFLPMPLLFVACCVPCRTEIALTAEDVLARHGRTWPSYLVHNCEK